MLYGNYMKILYSRAVHLIFMISFKRLYERRVENSMNWVQAIFWNGSCHFQMYTSMAFNWILVRGTKLLWRTQTFYKLFYGTLSGFMAKRKNSTHFGRKQSTVGSKHMNNKSGKKSKQFDELANVMWIQACVVQYMNRRANGIDTHTWKKSKQL